MVVAFFILVSSAILASFLIRYKKTRHLWACAPSGHSTFQSMPLPVIMCTCSCDAKTFLHTVRITSVRLRCKALVLTELKGSMQEPDNFHFYCVKKNAVKVSNCASVSKVLTKYYKLINCFFGSTCTKILIS